MVKLEIMQAYSNDAGLYTKRDSAIYINTLKSQYFSTQEKTSPRIHTKIVYFVEQTKNVWFVG